MPERKEERLKVEISSESFREIVNGEVTKEPKPREKKEVKKHKKPEKHWRPKQSEEVEKSLRNSEIEGIFNSAAGSIQSSYSVPLALALNATNAEIGIMNSLQGLSGTFAHLPGAMLTKFCSRKFIWVLSQIIARILIWIPVMFLPFLEVGNRVIILMVLLLVSNFFISLRSPSWSSLMGDLVSVKIRGRYFGRRNMLVGIAGVCATLSAGFLLACYGFHVIFLISIILGTVSIFFFLKMREPPMKRIFHYRYNFSIHPKNWYHGIILNKEFVIFTVYIALMNFAIEIAGPFYTVYMLKGMNIGYEWFAVSVVVGALARALTHQYWGKLNDRFGSRKILMICGFLGCFVPFGWMFVSNLSHIFMVKIYDGMIFSGFDLVVFNYLLDITPTKNRPKYIANHNFSIGFGVVFGNLLGGLLAQNLQHSYLFGFFGLQIVFLASFIIRLLCSSMLLWIKKIDVRRSEVVPVRYVFWQALVVEPVRGIRHVVTFTFRYPSKAESDLRNGLKNLKYKVRLKMNR